MPLVVPPGRPFSNPTSGHCAALVNCTAMRANRSTSIVCSSICMAFSRCPLQWQSHSGESSMEIRTTDHHRGHREHRAKGDAVNYTGTCSCKLQSRSLPPLPRSPRLTEVASPQISHPIPLGQLEIADDSLDPEPFIRRQFLPRHLQTHASLSGRGLDQERGFIPGRPAVSRAPHRPALEGTLGQS